MRARAFYCIYCKTVILLYRSFFFLGNKINEIFSAHRAREVKSVSMYRSRTTKPYTQPPSAIYCWLLPLLSLPSRFLVFHRRLCLSRASLHSSNNNNNNRYKLLYEFVLSISPSPPFFFTNGTIVVDVYQRDEYIILFLKSFQRSKFNVKLRH